MSTFLRNFYFISLESVDWNEKFQTLKDKILRKEGDLVKIYQELSQLARDFIESAKVITDRITLM
jgi:hypothetical protein